MKGVRRAKQRIQEWQIGKIERSCFAFKQLERSIIESHSEQVSATVITRTMSSVRGCCSWTICSDGFPCPPILFGFDHPRYPTVDSTNPGPWQDCDPRHPSWVVVIEDLGTTSCSRFQSSLGLDLLRAMGVESQA